ncbi:DNA-binding protein WhiA [Mycoplasma sp. U97]|uniref:DNA-binding protein WhiA n=1 Tax=Mycoplasma tauri TaxID=547987 RepID=UPI001CBC74F3|nr:DNA-binding protein WhiA [Mycoplasma tauri]MBZ4212901.1 DNA-binding protein WhiA [Mycoplasma tauri]
MNFTKQIKQEILSKRRNNEDALEFLRGFIYAKGIISDNTINLRIHDKITKNTILKVIDKIGITVINNKSIIKIKKESIDLEQKFLYPSSFFQGTFVGGGSISNLSLSSYHLQISSNYEKFINIMLNKLNEYNFNFIKIKHNSKILIYIKKHEKISDFLKAISVTTSFFNFIDNTISRDFHNSHNRLKNIDASNIEKTIKANKHNLENINYIKENNLLSFFTIKQLDLFNLMLENSNESLSALAFIYNQKNSSNISKSGIHHWLKKLDTIVNNHKVAKQ